MLLIVSFDISQKPDTSLKNLCGTRARNVTIDGSARLSDVRIVNIVGSPGFGKSTLAVHVGDQMVKQGVEVHYVNMGEYQGGQNIDIQIELAEKILRAADYSSDRYTFEDLIKWLRKLFWNSLIIIDDCDNLVHNNRTTFFHALEKIVEQTPRIKVLITSREVTIHLEYVRRYRIYELSKRASCELFEQILPVGTNLTTTEIEEIAELTGNAPLALQIVGALLSSPNPPSPSFIIDELNSRPIPFLSQDELQHEHKLNISIFLSYRYLLSEMRMISQYLAYFPGSFNLEAANAIIICGQAYPCLEAQNEPVTKTLKSLTSRSLIELRNKGILFTDLSWNFSETCRCPIVLKLSSTQTFRGTTLHF